MKQVYDVTRFARVPLTSNTFTVFTLKGRVISRMQDAGTADVCRRNGNGVSPVVIGKNGSGRLLVNVRTR